MAGGAVQIWPVYGDALDDGQWLPPMQQTAGQMQLGGHGVPQAFRVGSNTGEHPSVADDSEAAVFQQWLAAYGPERMLWPGAPLSRRELAGMLLQQDSPEATELAYRADPRNPLVTLQRAGHLQQIVRHYHRSQAGSGGSSPQDDDVADLHRAALYQPGHGAARYWREVAAELRAQGYAGALPACP